MPETAMWNLNRLVPVLTLFALALVRTGPLTQELFAHQGLSANAVLQKVRAAAGPVAELGCFYRRQTGSALVDDLEYQLWLGFPRKLVEVDTRAVGSGRLAERTLRFDGTAVTAVGVPGELTESRRAAMLSRANRLWDRYALLLLGVYEGPAVYDELTQQRTTDNVIAIRINEQDATIFISREDFHISRAEFRGLTSRRSTGDPNTVHDKEDAVVNVYLRDFRRTGVATMPYRITTEVQGTVEDDWLVQTYAINTASLSRMLR